MENSEELKELIDTAKRLFSMEQAAAECVPGHEGGRNLVFRFTGQKEERYLRISYLPDRTLRDYEAETEFVHYLAEKGAAVADVYPSINGRYVEEAKCDGVTCFLSLFEKAKGEQFAEHGYRYIEGRPLTEYFRQIGKTIGRIHRFAKEYTPVTKRYSYTRFFNMEEIDKKIPVEYTKAKRKINKILEKVEKLPITKETFGPVHFDYSDGNYMLDYETGNITVFDFDNCCYCYYLFDLANTWTHGVGFIQFEPEEKKRREFMEDFFQEVLIGYREETTLREDELKNLPLLISFVMVENVLDTFDTMEEGENPEDDEELMYQLFCLSEELPYYGFFSKYFNADQPFCLP